MTKKKTRHGLLLAVLVLVLVLNAMILVVYALLPDRVPAAFASAPGWAYAARGALAAVNMACVLAMLLWRRWGFYGYVASVAVTFGVSLSVGVGLAQALFPLVLLLAVFGALQTGKPSGWAQLE